MNIRNTVRDIINEINPGRARLMTDAGIFISGLGLSALYLGYEGDFPPLSISGTVVAVSGLAVALRGHQDQREMSDEIDREYENLCDLDS